MNSDISEKDLYAFDLNGYLVVEDAIEPGLLERVNRRVDDFERMARLVQPGTEPSPEQELVRQKRFERIILEDDLFLQVGMSPKVISKVVNFIQFPRLKSTWLDFKGRGGNIAFHANHTPYNPVDAYYFQNGIYANLVTVCYALRDIPLDGGALEVIPGSHKANYALPDDENFLRSLRSQVPLKAGSALIFSHDMHHGSCNNLDYIRRAMFTSFSTGSSAHTQGDNPMYDTLFEQSAEGSWQKYLLRRPKGDRDTYPMPTHSVMEERERSRELVGSR